VTLRWVDVVVPFGASYQPLWVGLGALSLDLMIAMVVTSLVRRRIGHRAWHAVHALVYLSWPVALVHTFMLGPDVNSGLQRWLAVGCVLASVTALGSRLLSTPAPIAVPDRAPWPSAAAPGAGMNETVHRTTTEVMS